MNRKIIAVLCGLFIIYSIDLFSKENKYFCVSNINMREKPSSKSRSLTIIKRGSIVLYIDKTDEYEYLDNQYGYWCKIEYNNKQGYVFNAYIAEFDGDNIEQVIDVYDKRSYFKNCNTWALEKASQGDLVGCDMVLSFAPIFKNSSMRNFFIGLQVYKNGRAVFVDQIHANKLIKVGDHYDFFENGSYFSSFGIKDDKLIIYDIVDIKVVKDGISFRTKELQGLRFISTCHSHKKK
jgi:hypothetical protein